MVQCFPWCLGEFPGGNLKTQYHELESQFPGMENQYGGMKGWVVGMHLNPLVSLPVRLQIIGGLLLQKSWMYQEPIDQNLGLSL